MGEATPMASQAQVLESAQLIEWQTRCRQQYCSQQLIDYVLDLVQATRQGGVGLSPRASQGLIAAARAWSLFEQRPHVTLDDVQTSVLRWLSTVSMAGSHRVLMALHRRRRRCFNR